MSTVSSTAASSSNPYQYGASVFQIYNDLSAQDSSGNFTASDIAKAAQTAQTAGNTDEFVLLSNMLQAPPDGSTNVLFNGQTTINGNDLLQLASADQGEDGTNGNLELTDNDITNTFGGTVSEANISSTDLTNIAAGTQTNLSASTDSTSTSSSSNPMTQILQLLLTLLPALLGGQSGGGYNPYQSGGYNPYQSTGYNTGYNTGYSSEPPTDSGYNTGYGTESPTTGYSWDTANIFNNSNAQYFGG